MAAWLIQHTIVAGLLVIIVSMICRFKLRSPTFRHVLWLAVLIKLMMPPLISWPWAVPLSLPQPEPIAAESIISDDHLPSHARLRVAPLEDDGHLAAEINPTILVSLEPEHNTDFITENMDEAAQPPHDHPEVVWGYEQTAEAALFVWLAGAVFMAVYRLVHVFKFHRLLARAGPAPAWLARHVAELRKTFNVPLSDVMLVPGIGSPELWCFGRPKLLWPERLATIPNPAQWRSVVAHELAHLHRKDHYVAWLELAAGCIWWWHPLFWYARSRIRENAELACDAWALHACPGSRRHYAEALIHVSQMVSGGPSPSSALALGVDHRRTFERRLSMIMKDPVSCKASFWGIVFCLLLVMVSLPAWSQSSEAPSGGPADPADLDFSVEPVEPGGQNAAVSEESSEKPDLQPRRIRFTALSDPKKPKSLEARVDKLEALLTELLHEVRDLRKAQQPPQKTASFRTTSSGRSRTSSGRSRSSSGRSGSSRPSVSTAPSTSIQNTRTASSSLTQPRKSTTIYRGLPSRKMPARSVTVSPSKKFIEFVGEKPPKDQLQPLPALPPAAAKAFNRPGITTVNAKGADANELRRLKEQIKTLERQLKEKDEFIIQMQIHLKRALESRGRVRSTTPGANAPGTDVPGTATPGTAPGVEHTPATETTGGTETIESR